MASNKTLTVQGVEIHLVSKNDEDYISLTDMVQGFDGGVSLIDSWLRNKNTLEFLAVWERINNPDFNSVEFDGIRLEAGTNRFRLSAKQWMDKVNGIGVIAKTGRYGGTFAHKDIAFEFGSWLSPEFKLYLIKEFQRLKDAEAQSGQLEWNIRRTLVKANYRIHTDSIKANLIPPTISKAQEGLVYATEADLLNKALFGLTAKEWRVQNPDKTDGNIRDYATVEQLVVLASLESQNALLIQQGHNAAMRLTVLNQLAISQIKSLLGNSALKKLDNAPLLEDKK
ncbi:MAG: KilA-N domain-containing protein [Moraxellaceae bacterium]|nr:KilA-N domain-containing protein [Pseudomonadales bacterium]MCP5177222.1 KilA-N domain-containing protein [Moraxellaceae bacterium]